MAWMLLPRGAMRRGEEGLLLVEMIVILTILGISLLAILSQSSSAVRGNRLAEQGSEATSLAQAKLEELKAAPFSTLASGTDSTTLGADGSGGGIFARVWTVTATTVHGLNGKRVTVSVSHPETAGAPVVSLSTLVVEIPQYAANFPTVVQRTWRRQ